MRTATEQRVLDNLSAAVLLFDADLRLNYINSAGEVLFAVSARHLIGQKAKDLVRCPGEQVEFNLTRAAKAGYPFTEREMRIPLADGREITVDCTVIPLRNSDGSDEMLVELHQVDRQMRINREGHLLAQYEAARDLIRSLAHEIKNPLGGLRGAAQLLEQELPDETLEEYTQIIIDEADRLQVLVDRMLGPNQLPRQTEVNVHQILERVRQLVQAEVGSGVRLQVDYDPSIPLILADADQLIQALLNIVRNGACAAGDQGQLLLRSRVLRQFTIGNVRHRLVIKLDIEDDGPGIPEELKERIFYPMVSGRAEGTGLGLSIAQSLINQHAGLIEYQSKPGKTVFTVYLPVRNHDDE